MTKITKHAKKRVKERCGINDKAMERMAEKILADGIKHHECSGKLKRWVDGLYLYSEKANNIRLYGDKAYLFHATTLITVIQIPNRLLSHVISIQKRKDKENDNFET